MHTLKRTHCKSTIAVVPSSPASRVSQTQLYLHHISQLLPVKHATLAQIEANMSSKDIRLRLAIRRHAVPEVKLVWPCVASEDLTVAKLLAQVNEVIPLESGEWGLEDYVVELADANGGSFECLHFQPVGKLFKGDDQVV